MAKIFIEETTLSNIGNAIRDKEGTSDLIPVNDMASRISAITTGGNEPTDEELTITGNCSYRFSNNGWSWFIDKYGDRITTKDITSCDSMFRNADQLEEIPFELNLSQSTTVSLACCFYNAQKMTTAPLIKGVLGTPASAYTYACNLNSLFQGCWNLRDISQDYFYNFGGDEHWKASANFDISRASMFSSCFSLRKLPDISMLSSKATYYNVLYYSMCSSCFALDEIIDLPVLTGNSYTNNMFYQTFYRCRRLRNLTFETNADGTPIQAAWKSQIIDLSEHVGHDNSSSNISYYQDLRNSYLRNCDILKHNSGITADKFVYDDATYQALKNDPDWFTCGSLNVPEYSRYNHDSAVATINSLPDTSAYLATAGGTNTIKFKGAAGSKTDGGAISTLTEAEIAVAASKGWTVTFA